MDYIQAGVSSLQNHVRESLDISEKRNVMASMLAGLLVSYNVNSLFSNLITNLI